MNSKRYTLVCIPGDESRGDEPAGFVFDLKLHRSVASARSRQEARDKAQELNQKGTR